MTEDIQKAVDAGKLTPRAGAALEQLTPGSWCLHKSWGFGRIAEINFLVNQVTINFQSRKGHTMQLDYAAESLQPIGADHVLAQKAENLEAVKTRAKDDPVGLVRQILENQGGRATQDQIGAMLLGDVFKEAELKRWWEGTKKLLKRDALISVPAKKSAPYELRTDALSRGDELLAEYFVARQIKPQIAAADQIARALESYEKPAEQLEPVVRGLEDSARKSQRLHTAQSFELVLARDEICGKVEGLEPAAGTLTITRLLQEEDRRLDDILGLIPAAKLKRILAELPAAFGENWVSRALKLMEKGNTRAAADISALLVTHGKREEVRHNLDRWIREHSISSDILCWLCKERDGEFGDLIEPRVFTAILSALERDQMSDDRRSYKLRDLVMDDKELVGDLLGGADTGEARDAMRRLQMTPVFEDLNKRSMLGRVIKVHPELQAMVTGETGEKQEALIVSWETLEKRKADYEELITKKIPENTKEISIARSYGDLRENFEFKAAKEMQRVLMRRKADWEAALSNARGTGFENPDTEQASIGTVVTVRPVGDGTESTYTILGAWDSEPASGIISYQTAMGQALLGHKVGEQVELPTEVGTMRVEIAGIRAWRAA